ncbi:MAG: TrkA family potassium uptake protein [Firmicutes bacterium]|nr:TrkA family potassium uptake protein [Bacillota bacterium]
MKQFAVIGLGRFGSSVAKTLAQMGYEVLGIDDDIEVVNNMADSLTSSVKADILDEQVFKTLGIGNFDVVVVGLGKEIQASILVTVMLKEMGVKEVVAKARTELHGRVLERVGADKVVFPERDMGVRLARALVSKNIMDQIALSPEYSLMEVAAPAVFVNKTLDKLGARQKYGISVLAIRRGAEVVISPSAGEVIKKGDILVVVGKDTQLRKLETL